MFIISAFTVRLPCTGNLTGIAAFSIGLELLSRRRKLAGTPLKLRLRWVTAFVNYVTDVILVITRKECVRVGINPSCDRLCSNHGYCDQTGGCVCRAGWEGERCDHAVCDPQCMNGGACSSPGVCDCPAGFQGRSCEGGICETPCQNNGKCIQKDTCQCKSGWYGTHCQFSKCVVPCLNGGQCRGVNKCRCLPGFTGDHCQVVHVTKKKKGIDSVGEDPCSRQQCRSFKRCRKQNCGYINKDDKMQMRTCKIAHCGSLLLCSQSSCHRKLVRTKMRGRRRKFL